jgi:hypothetical protein
MARVSINFNKKKVLERIGNSYWSRELRVK